MGEIKRPWFGIPSLTDAPTGPDIGPAPSRWGSKVSLDKLRDDMEAARRAMEKAEVTAKHARDAAEGYREQFEMARDELVKAIEELNLFPTDPPREADGKP